MSARDKTAKPRPKATSSKIRNKRSQPSTANQILNKTSGTTTASKAGTERDKKTNDQLNRKSHVHKPERNSYFGTEEEEAELLNEMSAPILPHKDINRANNAELEQETDVDGEERSHYRENDSDENRGLLNASPDSDSSSKTINSETPGFKSRFRLDNEHVANKAKLPRGWEQHSDKDGLYYWHVSSGIIQRSRPTEELSPRKNCVVVYHDDEEINQAQRISSDDEDYCESGAALTAADDNSSESAFVVFLLGCCDFDETQLVSATRTKEIQKCILRLSNRPRADESHCWGLDQTKPVLMKLFDDYIQFTDMNSQTILRSQPIGNIKTWAVDDDNNFAFVVEDRAKLHRSPSANKLADLEDQTPLNEPVFMCYVFRSMDDDDMCCKVATKLSDRMNRIKELISDQIIKSTRLQQMVKTESIDDQTDVEDFDELVASNELTMDVKYIGKTSVPQPTGIDILNEAIDECLAEASNVQINSRTMTDDMDDLSPLVDAKLHVSPSSVIVENVLTGEIIVECRIRYLTFMGISKRDMRWYGFIMQDANKTFVAHCFECQPTAIRVCEAIQSSCSIMYEKLVKSSRRSPETMSIIPTRSRIRSTLAKTFSRIRLNPIS